MSTQQHHNTTQALKLSKLLAPKYWLTWLIVGIFYALCRLPYSWLLVIGRGIGKLVYCLMPKWRHITATNLALCFPEKSEKERHSLAKQSFVNLGMSLMETGMSWWKPLDRLPPIHIEGMEHVYPALAQKKGILLLGSHFTTLDIVARLISQQYPLQVVGRHQNNAVVDALLKHSRNSKLITLLDRKNLRGIVKALKNNAHVWYAPDQDYGKKRSVFVPFFGIPTATITIPSRLAELSQSPVLYVAYYRRPHGQGYKIVFSPPLENFPSQDTTQDAKQVNQLIEQAIRQHPEQYLWIHRRFKTRPEGASNPYAKTTS